MTEISKRKVPPTGGSHLPHAQPSSFEIQVELTTAAGLRRIRRLGRNNWIWRLSDDVRRAGADAAVDYFL
jgi:hypothetical protein